MSLNLARAEFPKKPWKLLEMLIQKSHLSVEIWLPHLYFISSPNWMWKETLDINFIPTACALQSSTAVDRDIPAVHQVRGQWTCPGAHLNPLPERCDELQDCDSWAKTLLQCRAWYWGRRKLQQGCTNTPKIITELTSEKKTIVFCKPLCFLELKCGGRGVDQVIALPYAALMDKAICWLLLL